MVTDVEEITVRQAGTKRDNSVHRDQPIPRNRGNNRKKERKYWLNIQALFQIDCFKVLHKASRGPYDPFDLKQMPCLNKVHSGTQSLLALFF